MALNLLSLISDLSFLYLAEALYYLHRKNIHHRDLKLENILVKNSKTNNINDIEIRITGELWQIIYLLFLKKIYQTLAWLWIRARSFRKLRVELRSTWPRKFCRANPTQNNVTYGGSYNKLWYYMIYYYINNIDYLYQNGSSTFCHGWFSFVAAWWKLRVYKGF